ncbi:MAG TPA: hypothetical protein DHU63_08490, partial [Candidatus Marinimicrobia bacterium]|nr:hypothetical protein [Candidatus Neomarinimicrobiota bacterium]
MFLARLRSIWRISLFLVVCFTLLRLIFLVAFFPQFNAIPFIVLLKSFFIGFRLDIRLAMLVVLPFFLISLLPGLGFYADRPKRTTFWRGYFMVIWMLILL